MSGSLDFITNEAAAIVAALDAIEVVLSSEDVERYRSLTERAVDLVRLIAEVDG